MDWWWPRNSTKQLYWLFTKEINALTTSPNFSNRLISYPRPTVIYILVFLPSVVLYDKKTFISLSNKNPIRYENIILCFHCYRSVTTFISDRPSVSITTDFLRYDFRNGEGLERSDSESDTRLIVELLIRSKNLIETHLER